MPRKKKIPDNDKTPVHTLAPIGVKREQETAKETANVQVLEVPPAHESRDNSTPKTWQSEVCKALARGDEALKVILESAQVSPERFFQELRDNTEFKAQHDEAMKIQAQLAQYGLWYLALHGTASDRKALSPMLIEQYGPEDAKNQPEDDAPSGESEGL